MTVFESLPAAVEAALDWQNFNPERLNLARWAISFNCTPEDVEAEFAKQKWARSRLTETMCEESDK